MHSKNTVSQSISLVITLCLAMASGFAQAAAIKAEVDRTRIALSETLRLTVTVYEQVHFSAPDFSDLEQQFDVIDNRRSNQYRSVNGKTTSFTQWVLTIAPKQQGKLLIPSFKYDDNYTDAIEIEVVKQAPQQSQQRDIFIETQLDKQEVFVQEQVILRQRLFTAVNLRSIDPQPLQLDGSRVEKIDENQYQTRIQGRLYHVVDMSYAIYPQSSGQLDLPALRWNIMVSNGRRNVFDPFGNDPAQLRRLSSEAKTVTVKAIPQGANPWLPAKEVEITQSWSADPGNIKTGEPITRSIEIKAVGLTAAQLPNVSSSTAQANHLKVYPEQPKANDKRSRHGIIGRRSFTEALIANKAGIVELDAIEIRWWDTTNKQWQTARLPAQTLTITGTVSDSAGQQQHSSNTPADSGQATATDISNGADANQGNSSKLMSDKTAVQKSGISSWILAAIALAFAAATALLLGLYLGLRKNYRQLEQQMEQLIDKAKSEQQQRLKPKLAIEQLFQRLEQAIQQDNPEDIGHYSQQVLIQLQQNHSASFTRIKAEATALNTCLDSLNKALYGQGETAPDLSKLIEYLRALQHELESVKTDNARPAQDLMALNP